MERIMVYNKHYITVDEHIWCCGDEAQYNRIIDIRRHPHQCSGEHMADYTPEYNYGLFFDYNIEGTPGLGFAIFLHCKGAKPYTGAVAVEAGAVVKAVAYGTFTSDVAEKKNG